MAAGEFMGVLGANGAGKSTLLKAISGLVRPTRGAIELGTDSVLELPPHRVPGLGIAHVPERRRVFPSLSVLDNLALGAYATPAELSRAELLDEVFGLFPKLKERSGQLAGSLSGGEQQMLAVGRALMLKPRLLMLDEPSLGLAPKVIDEVFALVRELRDEGIAVLLVEQNARRAAAVADRAMLLRHGSIDVIADHDRAAALDAYFGLAATTSTHGDPA
jgi:branched-chain amino acid transport system ATP-binding protein